MHSAACTGFAGTLAYLTVIANPLYGWAFSLASASMAIASCLYLYHLLVEDKTPILYLKQLAESLQMFESWLLAFGSLHALGFGALIEGMVTLLALTVLVPMMVVAGWDVIAPNSKQGQQCSSCFANRIDQLDQFAHSRRYIRRVHIHRAPSEQGVDCQQHAGCSLFSHVFCCWIPDAGGWRVSAE